MANTVLITSLLLDSFLILAEREQLCQLCLVFHNITSRDATIMK